VNVVSSGRLLTVVPLGAQVHDASRDEIETYYEEYKKRFEENPGAFWNRERAHPS
jgi:hypothetical protein